MIIFRRTKDEYGWLSNMCGGYPIKLFDIPIKTTQALYQALKFDNKQVQEYILNQNSPIGAKKVSRFFNCYVRKDWDQIKFNVMKFCNQLKFQGYPQLMQKLINTNNEQIVQYDRDVNSYWGKNHYANTGKNNLGKVLMQIRDGYGGDYYYNTVGQFTFLDNKFILVDIKKQIILNRI